MTINKYPPIPNITRPVLAQDPIIETTQNATTFSKTNFVAPGNYIVEASQSSALTISGAGMSFLVTTDPVIINSTGGNFTVSAYTKPIVAIRRSMSNSSTASWGSVYEGLDRMWTMGTSNANTFASSSSDGITWNATTMPIAAQWQWGTFGAGSYVAVSFGTSHAASSTNGITWTQRTLPVSASWNTVIYATGANITSGFYAVAGGGTSYAAYSANSITWSIRTLPANGSWKPLIFDGTRLLTINAAGSQVATSTDGTTWTIIGNMPFTPVAPGLWNSVTYDNSIYLSVFATNVASSQYATSTNGITWTQRNFTKTASWSRGVYGAGYFFATAQSGSDYSISTNGISWTNYNYDFTSGLASPNYISRYNAIYFPSGTASTGHSYIISIKSPLPDGQVIFGMYKV